MIKVYRFSHFPSSILAQRATPAQLRVAEGVLEQKGSSVKSLGSRQKIPSTKRNSTLHYSLGESFYHNRTFATANDGGCAVTKAMGKM
uniref:Uncharacterized protein n=1 Tax=Trichogramma kaykai TaxID=54128 RepID=A0ABD2VZI3_9HYME